MSDPVDPIDAIAANDTTNAAINVRNAVGTNPEAAARYQALSGVLGLPADTIKRNPAPVEQRVGAMQAQSIAPVAPATTGWLASDPGNAAVAHDRLGPLAALEQTVTRIGADMHRGLAAFNEGAFGGLTQAVQGVGAYLDALTTGQGIEYGVDTSGDKSKPGAAFVAPAVKPLQAAQQYYAGSLPPPQKRNVVDKGLGMAGNVGTALLSGPLAPLMFGAQGAEQSAEKGAQTGASEDAQASNTILGGDAQALLGALPVAHWAEALIPELKSALLTTAARFGVGTAGAAGQGAAMQVASNAAAKATVDPNQDLGEGVADQAAQMALLHGILRAPGAVSDVAAHVAAVRDAKASGEALNAAADMVRSEPVATRAPDRFRALLDAMAPDQNVYIPAEAAQRYLQSAPADGYATFDRAGVADQIGPALQSGSDIVMPVSDYLAHIAPGDAHEALAGDVKTAPDALSLNQAKDFDDHYQDYIAQRGAELSRQAQADAAASTPAQRVYDEVFSQMRGAGRSLDASKQYAGLVAAHSEAFGQINGRDAYSEYQTMPLTVRQELPEKLASSVDKLDHVIDSLRAAKEQPPGQSLLDFVSKKGGITDEGGEFAKLDPDAYHKAKPFRRKLVTEGGMHPDDMAQAAQEAGYIKPDYDPTQTEEYGGSEPANAADLHDAMRQELSGHPVYSVHDIDERREGMETAQSQLQDVLSRLGMSVHDHSNTEIKNAVGEFLKKGDFEQATQPRGEFSRAFAARVEAEHPDVKFSLNDNGSTATLSRIEVPAADREKGVGSKIMTDLTKAADEAGVRLALSPSGAFGGSTARLREFYKRFGFTENKGRGRSFSTSETMTRNPPGQTYEQSARGDISFPPGKAVIRLFKASDPSTPIHELGHYFLEKLKRAAETEGATEEVKDLWSKAQAFLGHESGPLSVDQHEQFARGFEAYAMEGKAPSEGLRTVFRKFSQWLTKIYQSVKALDVNLTPNIRDVFDRLLASQDEIKAAQERAALNPIFAKPEDGMMTKEEYAAYTKSLNDANGAAQDKLLERLTETIRRQRTKEWKEEAAALRPEMQAKIDGRADVKAYHYLTRGELLGADEQPGRLALNKEAVTSMYGTDAVLSRLPKSVPPVYSAEGGVHPDLVAEMTGSSSGEAMLDAVMNLEAQRRDMRERGDNRQLRRAMVEDAVNEEMRQRHGDPLNDGSIEEEALDALHNDARLRQVSMEVRALGKMVKDGEPQWTGEAMKKWAEGYASTMKANALQPNVFARAERQAGIEAQRHLLAGDNEKALERKRQQLLNMHLYRAVKDAQAEVVKAQRQFARVGARAILASTDQEHLNQVHGLLERFGYASPSNVQARDDLQSFLDARRAAYESIVVPDWLVPESVKKQTSEMTVQDVSDLHDAVQSLLYAGREAKRVTIEGRKQSLEEWLEKLRDASGDIPNSAPQSTLKTKTRPFSETLKAFTKIETIADHLDGGDPNGPMNRLFIQRASDANLDKLALSKEIMGKVVDARNEVPKAIRRSWMDKIEAPEFTDPDTGKPLQLTRYDLLQVALNTGTESNFDKMVEGMGWKRESVEAVLNRYLRPEEMKFVGSLWDSVGSLWPRIAETEKALSGVVPEKVAPRAVSFAGVDHEGGYWPLVRDPIRGFADRNGGDTSLEDLFSSSFSGVATPKGHTISRNQAAYPISFDLDHVLGKHLNDAITRATYGQFVADAMRTLNNKDFKRIIEAKVGKEAHALMVDWLRRQVGYRLINPRDVAGATKFLRAARINAMTVQTGFSLVVGAEHAAAYAQTIGKLGAARTAQGVGRYLSNPLLNAKYVLDRSPEMKASFDAQDRELRDQMDDLNSKSLKEPTALKIAATPFRAAQHLSHDFISWISQYSVRIPTWLAAESEGMSQGMTPEDAARFADKVVRTTHGTGFEKDLPKIQSMGSGTAGEALKLLTMYRGYHLTQANQLIEAGYKAKRGNAAGALNQGFWVGIAAPIISASLLGGLKGALPPTWHDWPLFIVDHVLRAAWAPVPIVAEATDAVTNAVEGKPLGYEATPAERAVGSTASAAVDLSRIARHAVGMDTDKDVSPHALQHFIEAPGYFLGMPTGQPARIIQNVADMADGKVQPKDPVDAIRHAAYGTQPHF